MRRKGFSPSKSKVNQQISSRQKQQDSIRKQDQNRYSYCHYTNAVYMGEMDGLSKHGRGILLHDDGSSAITEYRNDVESGHNVIFRANSVESRLQTTNESYEIAYKAGKSIICVPFNRRQQPHGKGVLVDYGNRKIEQLQYDHGKLTRTKTISASNILESVLDNGDIKKVMRSQHQAAFKLAFPMPEGVIVRHKDSVLTIGYTDRKGDFHGLAFRLYVSNLVPSGEKPLYLKTMERGYYRAGYIDSFGEQNFEKGMRYIGEFARGQFDGKGVIIWSQDKKWVHGIFRNHKLLTSIRSNHAVQSEGDSYGWVDELMHLHQEFKQRYIDRQISLQSEHQLHQILQDALHPVQRTPVASLERVKEESQIDRLNESYQTAYQARLEKIQHFETGESKVHISLPSSALPQARFSSSFSNNNSRLIHTADPETGSKEILRNSKEGRNEKELRREGVPREKSMVEAGRISKSNRTGEITNSNRRHPQNHVTFQEPLQENKKAFESSPPLRREKQAYNSVESNNPNYSTQPILTPSLGTPIDPLLLTSYSQILQKHQRNREITEVGRSRLADFQADRARLRQRMADENQDYLAEVLRRFRYSPAKLSSSSSSAQKFQSSNSREKHVSSINKRVFKYLQEDGVETKTSKYPITHTRSPVKNTEYKTTYSQSPASQWAERSMRATPPSYFQDKSDRNASPESRMRPSRNPTFLLNNYINKT